MNKIDIANIKKELAKRKAANYDWKDGGEMTKDDIMLRTTKDLNQLLEDFTNNANKNAEENTKKLVDEIFAKWSDNEKDNMIVISAAHCPERSVYEVDNPLDDIYFGDDEYNKLYKPIGRDWEGRSYWDRKDMTKEQLDECDKKWDPFFEDVHRLRDAMYNIKGVTDAESYWCDDNDALNECWYGVIGIMKDYRIVAFVIRDDGMLCDEDGYETFNNEIIYTIK